MVLNVLSRVRGSWDRVSCVGSSAPDQQVVFRTQVASNVAFALAAKLATYENVDKPGIGTAKQSKMCCDPCQDAIRITKIRVDNDVGNLGQSRD